MTKTSLSRVRSRRSSLPIRFSGKMPHLPSLQGSEPSSLDRITGYLVRKVSDLVHSHGRTWIKRQWEELTTPRQTHHRHRAHEEEAREETKGTRLAGERGKSRPLLVKDHPPPKTSCRRPPRKSYLRLLQEGPKPPTPPRSSQPSDESETSVTPRDEVPVIRSPDGGIRPYMYPIQSPMESDEESEEDFEEEDWPEGGWSLEAGGSSGLEPYTLTTIHQTPICTRPPGIRHHPDSSSVSFGELHNHLPRGAASYVPPPWETPTLQVTARSRSV